MVLTVACSGRAGCQASSRTCASRAEQALPAQKQAAAGQNLACIAVTSAWGCSWLHMSGRWCRNRAKHTALSLWNDWIVLYACNEGMQSRAGCRVAVETGALITGRRCDQVVSAPGAGATHRVRQHGQQASPDGVEAAHHTIVHPEVATPLERVAVLLADRHAWVGSAHVGEDHGGRNLGTQPGQVLIVPAVHEHSATCQSATSDSVRRSAAL